MGAVYEVVHEATRRRRALKVMLPDLVHDKELRARFELEARVTADVESDHIVETFDAGVDDETGAPFLVMELLRGEDLRAMLERGRLAPSDVVALLLQAARALERTHAAGVVHRDLKPDNLFVTRRDDGSPHVKILDFGIAKLIAQSTASMLTTRGIGAPHYMAPEQIRGDGDIDQRADVYSIGQIAFALLVGEPYWQTEARASGSVYPLLLKIAQGAKEPATVRAQRLGAPLPDAFDAWFGWVTAVEAKERADDVQVAVRRLAALFGVPVADAGAADVLPLPTLAGPPMPQVTSLSAALPAERTGRTSRGPALGLGAIAIGVVGVALWARVSGGPGTLPSTASAAASQPISGPALSPPSVEPPPIGAPIPVSPAPSASALAEPSSSARPSSSATPSSSVPVSAHPRPRPLVAMPQSSTYTPPSSAPGSAAPPVRDPSDTR
jgi:serine/threonine-protein kinase